MVGFLGRLRGAGIVVIKPVLLHEIGNRLTSQAGEAKGLANNRRPKRGSKVGQDAYDKLMEEIELLDGASAEFDQELVTKGELSPVFFGSALTNFGVETFLQHFLKMTYSPLPRKADIGEVDPFGEDFSAFVFKIQANMNKAHRDRIAFMRICSGKFTAGMEVTHVQGGNKKIKLSQPQQMMAQERHIVDEAYEIGRAHV